MSWKGVIIEESLDDKSLFNLVTTIKTEEATLEEEEKKETLHFHNIILDEDKKDEFIKKAKRSIKQGWYIHICLNGRMVVIFKDRSFEFTESEQDKIKQAHEYGLSIGIVKEQMEFQDMITKPYS